MSRSTPDLRQSLPAIVLLGSIVAAYLWLHTPSLVPFSLQAFAAATLIYLVIKRTQKAKIWHLVPSANSLEMALLTFAFLLLIGATGNTSSYFFALGYIHLFFIVLTMSVPTALVATTGVLLFHLGLTPELTTEAVHTLLMLPLLFTFFLFAKRQYDEARLDRQIIAQDALAYQELQNEEQSLKVFLQQFLQPKLAALESLAQEEDQLKTLRNQLSLLQTEIAKLLQRTR
jgi:signal transduction histidine kinase